MASSARFMWSDEDVEFDPPATPPATKKTDVRAANECHDPDTGEFCGGDGPGGALKEPAAFDRNAWGRQWRAKKKAEREEAKKTGGTAGTTTTAEPPPPPPDPVPPQGETKPDGAAQPVSSAPAPQPKLPTGSSRSEWRASLKEQKAHARTAGFNRIKVEKGVDPKVAAEHIHQLTRVRTEMEDEIRLPSKMKIKVGTTQSEDALATYNSDTKTVTISKDRGAAAHDPAARASLMAGHQTGFYSSGSADHVYRHELGHASHARSLYKQVPFGESEKNVARQVSRYATTNHAEFVAEVVAGHMGGKRYSPEVMKLYKQVGGRKFKRG